MVGVPNESGVEVDMSNGDPVEHDEHIVLVESMLRTL
jgi:hypothetical protein